MLHVDMYNNNITCACTVHALCMHMLQVHDLSQNNFILSKIINYANLSHRSTPAPLPPPRRNQQFIKLTEELQKTSSKEGKRQSTK